MLKTYKQRVESTYALMETMLDFLGEKGEELVSLRDQVKISTSSKKDFEISWSVDTSRYTPIMFSGYEPTYVESEISGLKRLKYDRDQPFTKEVKFRDDYIADKLVSPGSSSTNFFI